jgi:hypothetical protein
MKVYAVSPTAGSATPAIVAAVGLPPHRRQVRFIIAARSKAEAFRMLSARKVGPDSVRDPELAVGMGDDVDLLASVDLLSAPVVYAVEGTGVIGEVVRVEEDGSPTVVGRIERAGGDVYGPLRFVPTAAGLDPPPWTEPMTLDDVAKVVAAKLGIDLFDATETVRDCAPSVFDALGFEYEPGKHRGDGVKFFLSSEVVGALIGAAEDQYASTQADRQAVLDGLRENKDRVEAINAELAELRLQRGKLAGRAIELDIISAAAEMLDVTGPRIYQLRDAAAVQEANRKRQVAAAGKPGVVGKWVRFQLKHSDQANQWNADRHEEFLVGEAKLAYDGFVNVTVEGWRHGHRVPREHIEIAAPACSICMDPRTIGMTGPALSVHQLAQHGA